MWDEKVFKQRLASLKRKYLIDVRNMFASSIYKQINLT